MEVLEEDPGYTERAIKYILKQLFAALRYLHITKGICHRDIKTENICVSNVEKFTEHDDEPKIRIKLIDFGFA